MEGHKSDWERVNPTKLGEDEVDYFRMADGPEVL